MKIPFLKKNVAYDRATIGLIIRKILVSDMESCYKNISKIRNIKFIFQNIQKSKKKLKQFIWILKNQ